jgi:hypothetical protein
MAILNPSNQLIQIDTGKVKTYLFNPAASPISVYANIGEIQVPGQRYVGLAVGSDTAANPFGAPAIYMLAKYLATSATTLAQWQAALGPAPVYWTDETFTTVSGIYSEAYNSLGSQMIAGYLMLNYTDAPKVTLAQLLGGYVFIQVAGFLKGAWGPTTTPGSGYNIVGSAGNFTSTGSASASAVRQLGVQLNTATVSAPAGLCDVLVTADIF